MDDVFGEKVCAFQEAVADTGDGDGDDRGGDSDAGVDGGDPRSRGSVDTQSCFGTSKQAIVTRGGTEVRHMVRVAWWFDTVAHYYYG